MGLLEWKWIQLATTWKHSLLKQNLGKWLLLRKENPASTLSWYTHIPIKKRRAQNQNWRSSFSIQWYFVQCTSQYLEEKSPIPRQFNRFYYCQDDLSSKIPACGAVCHTISHFPGMLDLQEGEMILACCSEKESVSKTVGKFCMAGQPCKNMLFFHAKSVR